MNETGNRPGPRVLVIIPAFNEERSVGAVVRAVMAAGYDALVVSDGSSDNTERAAAGAGAQVLALPINLGIGGAMQAGFIYALRHRYDIAVQADGDGQHDLTSLDAVIRPVAEGVADMAIGSRFRGKAAYRVPIARRLGMLICSFTISLLYRSRITDTTSGFRAVNRDLIQMFAHEYPADYPEVEVLVRLRFAGKRVCEVPVRMFERRFGRSNIGSAGSMYYMLKLPLAIVKNVKCGVR